METQPQNLTLNLDTVRQERMFAEMLAQRNYIIEKMAEQIEALKKEVEALKGGGSDTPPMN
jgi:hypothetical protein